MISRVVLISLYNREFAFGVRHLSTALHRGGHACDLVFFKQMTSIDDPTTCLELTPNSNFCQPCSEREVDLLIDTLRELAPSLIGMSVISSFYRLAARLTERIRQELGVPVIWGGPHTTLLPENALLYADMACVGEGEEAIVDLADALATGRDPSGIANLWVRMPDGEVRRNAPRPLAPDLDQVGFADFHNDARKHYIDGDARAQSPPHTKEHPGATIDLMTSRGCPFQCTYCCVEALRKATRGQGPSLRRHSVEHVIEEILQRLAANDGQVHIHFWDDVFTLDEAWITRFAAAYRRRIGLPFTCYAHPEFTSPRTLELLRDAGLDCVNIGIQSGSERIARELYDRKTGNERIVAAAHTLHELGIAPWYDLIVDNPYEDDDDHRATLELLLRLPRPLRLNLHSLCYFPRTRLTERALADGLITEDDVEGPSAKAVNHFRMALDKPRSRGHRFWNVLIGMTRHDVLAPDTLRALSRSRVLRDHPALLQTMAVSALRWRRLSASARGVARKRSALAVASLRKRRGVNGSELAVKLENRGRRPRAACLALRSYPARDPRHPERYLGAWNLPVTIPPGGLDLTIEMAFPQVRFLVDGAWRGPSDLWIGEIRETGQYCIEVILYDGRERALAQRLLSCHSSGLFEEPERMRSSA